MAKLRMVAAARAAGVHRSTLDRYCKSGKLSFETDEDGNRSFDTSELIRVFGELRDPEASPKPSPEPPQEPPLQQPETPKLVAFLEQQVAALQQDNDRLRTELEAGATERRELQDRYLKIIERAQLTAGSNGHNGSPRPSSTSGQADTARRPHRQRPPPVGESIVNGLSSWLGGSR